MFQKSNRHLYKPFNTVGKNEFLYQCNISFFSDSPNDDFRNTTNTPIPLFAPNMFETLYNEITNSLGQPNQTSSNVTLGVANYGGNIWDAFAGLGGGGGFLNHTNMYPYGGPDVSGFNGFFTNDFYMKIGTGSILNPNDSILSGWIKIVSQKMAYINFLRTLQTKKVHCSKINVQWQENANNTTKFLTNPITFFDQKITGQIETNELTIGRFLNPQNVISNQEINGPQKQKIFNIDIPCDWIFSASSGVSIGWDCLYGDYNDMAGGMNLTFTLHEIE